MIEPIQPQTIAATAVSVSEPSPPSAGVSPSAETVALAGNGKSATPTNGGSSAQAALASGSNGASDSQSSSDAAQSLRLLIEHDKTTNHYVYKLYDSSGRIVREIPQESLADAEKQAAGATGAVVDTKV